MPPTASELRSHRRRDEREVPAADHPQRVRTAAFITVVVLSQPTGYVVGS
jgi:hypothetical protein